MNTALLDLRRLGLALALSTLAPLTAAAGDYYVDAAAGSDANDGSSPAQAWRTITFAMTQLPGWDQTVHIAPGVYDAAHGESFPIRLRERATLVGDQGPELTVLDAGGASLLLDASEVDHACLNGLWLRDAVVGIDAELALGADGWIQLEDSLLSDMQRGIEGAVTGVSRTSSTTLRVELLRTTIRDCAGEGVSLYATSFLGDDDWAFALLDATDARIEGCGVGVYAGSDPSMESTSTLFLRGCVVVDNDSGLVADELDLFRTTVAGNASTGLCALHVLSVDSCIVAGNGDDVGCFGSHASVVYSNFGDGSAGNMHGNLAADPLFLDPANGDYRLRFWSPCVDAGTPDFEPPTHDGDLDTAERLDMGAFELATLAVRGTPGLGQPLELELWGPSGGAARVYVAAGLPLEAPELTPFGQLDLPRSRARTFALGVTAPGPAGLLTVQVPAELALARGTFSFQALSTSSVPTPHVAWTNVVTVTLTP